VVLAKGLEGRVAESVLRRTARRMDAFNGGGR